MPAPEEPVENNRNDPMQAEIHAALRERFRSFLNDDARFRKFIRACNEFFYTSRELRYWQQQEWDIFIKEYPEYATLSVPAIRDAFHVCHVHLDPLKQVEVPIHKGVRDIYYAPEAERARSENAPYSQEFSLDSEYCGNRTHITTSCCDKCLAWWKAYGR
ncbi:hypothetical protein V6x_18370 [Gimesia chilikensis]|uniref:Uncharacterized protein n=1 Tax=Gimesia chilikensis TaxID=2605989 RepID=A0A517WA61_9PLAN|nr:hypothetical protein [Gimesia chilikensis]QDU02136.1 hypothetical protein V6x_18370 [Gimesia chilikensis]